MGRSTPRRAVLRLLAGLIGGAAGGLTARHTSAQSTCLTGNGCTATCLKVSADLHFICDRNVDPICARPDDPAVGRMACHVARATCQFERFNRDLRCKCEGCYSARETCCSGACVDLVIDENNCGACGVKCGPGETCDDGACSCGGQSCAFGVCCGGRCMDPGNLRLLPVGARAYRYQPDEGELCCEDGQAPCGTLRPSCCPAGETCCEQTGQCGPPHDPCGDFCPGLLEPTCEEQGYRCCPARHPGNGSYCCYIDQQCSAPGSTGGNGCIYPP